jgi:hypothetical protein
MAVRAVVRLPRLVLDWGERLGGSWNGSLGGTRNDRES